MLQMDCLSCPSPEEEAARRVRDAERALRRPGLTAEEREALTVRWRLDRLELAFLSPAPNGIRPVDSYRRAMRAVRAAFRLAPDTPDEAVFAHVEAAEGGITNHVIIMEAHGVPALYHWGSLRPGTSGTSGR